MSRLFNAALSYLTLCILLCPAAAWAQDTPMEALLVWGTHDGSSPKPEHKPIGPILKKQFEVMPFKWKNYFEEKRVQFSINTNHYTRVDFNKNCSFDVKCLGASRIKVKLYGKDKEGKDKEVVRHEKPLGPGDTLIIAGDDKNDNSQSAWFIVIRHPAPPAAPAAPAKPVAPAPQPKK
ncbi:MAG: hypothetical protein HYR88_06445 [Verrucomicrobia bacterium]|nr:hypothetical protein [Verrucomicrobiota bacterium]MBI3869741.1 hypothetical protein [Verrucomicrobiota bacterium]